MLKNSKPRKNRAPIMKYKGSMVSLLTVNLDGIPAGVSQRLLDLQSLLK